MTTRGAVLQVQDAVRSRVSRRHGIRDDDGSILPLIAVFAALGLAVILVVAAATSLYVERKRLFTIADGAALAGAEAFPLDQVDDGGADPTRRLEEARVEDAIRDYVAAAPGAVPEALAVEDAGAGDGRSATVTLSAYWRPPIITAFAPEGVRIEVTAVARAVLG